MHKRTVWMQSLGIEFIVHIPDDADDEEYIDKVFDEILNEKCRYSHWDFTDGIS